MLVAGRLFLAETHGGELAGRNAYLHQTLAESARS
jgi:hypothetical protein